MFGTDILYDLLMLMIGIILGFLLGWYYVGRSRTEHFEESERHWHKRINDANQELRSANEDNLEIKERFLALQDEHLAREAAIRDALEARDEGERKLGEARAQKDEAVAARVELERELDRARNALAFERARLDEVRGHLARLEQAAHHSGAEDGAHASVAASMKASLMDRPSPSRALHEEPGDFKHAPRAAGDDPKTAGSGKPDSASGVGSMVSAQAEHVSASASAAKPAGGDDDHAAAIGWSRSGSGAAVGPPAENRDDDKAAREKTAGREPVETATDIMAHGRRALRKLDQKIAQLPAGSDARRKLEAERRALIDASNGRLARPVDWKPLIDMPSPSLALHETAMSFSGQSSPHVEDNAPAASPESLQQRRGLHALDAKIAQLPAGSDARRKLEDDRTALLEGGRKARADDVAKAADDVRPAAGKAVSADDGGRQPGVPVFSQPEVRPDDLKRIKGIGPKLERTLHGLGVRSFAQLAAFTDDDIARIDDVLDFKGRIQREDWVGQARRFMRGRESP